MTELTLKKLLSARDGPGPALDALLATLNEPLRVTDQDGQLLFSTTSGSRIPDEACYPILSLNQPVGYLFCRRDCRLEIPLTRLLGALFDQEAVKKALASDVLDRYRELNLLYRLSDKLISAPDVRTVADLALTEACPLIEATSGLVILSQPDQLGYETTVTCGGPVTIGDESLRPEGILWRVLHTGNGDMANQVDGSLYFPEMRGRQISILCSPLRTERSIRGAMILINDAKAYTAGDLKLLNTIAMQAGPVIEMIQLHQFELEKARFERDLFNAHQVQADLLPREMPVLPGWDVAAYWQPARMVGGDFYDFIRFSDGRIGFVVADVAGKGMPAALVMANTRTILRTVAAGFGKRRTVAPGKILEGTNNLLYHDMPQHLFVTCLLAILDPLTGVAVYANAGHNLPYHSSQAQVIELRATGLPLGLFPNVKYEEKETTVRPGETLIIYSDGLPEAHDPKGEMFDYARMRECIAELSRSGPVIGAMLVQALMQRLHDFTGPHWEQEDDVTLLSVTRSAA